MLLAVYYIVYRFTPEHNSPVLEAFYLELCARISSEQRIELFLNSALITVPPWSAGNNNPSPALAYCGKN